MGAALLTLHNQDGARTLQFRPRRLVIAGYTARDRENVQRHIDELAELGIAPPDTVPAFWELPLDLLTQDSAIAVTSNESSGEVEPVLMNIAGEWYIGLGSDHTARDVERDSIRESKASCGKPLGTEIVPLDTVRGQWDSLQLRSYADDIRYQDSPVSEMLPLDDILDAFRASGDGDTDGLVMFLGTVPLIGGRFRYSASFRGELANAGGTLLTCNYTIERKD